jgi:hypothetical protein
MSLRKMTQAKDKHSTAQRCSGREAATCPDWRQIMVRQEIEDVASDVHLPMLKVERST